MAARRVQLGVGVGLVLLLGVVLALVLLRDPAGGSPSASPPTQPVPTRPDMAQLRAEAAAAAEHLFRKIDEADATGNPAVLDGLYTEGAKAVEDGQKQAVRKRLEQGLVSVRHSRVTDLRVEELTTDIARVRLTWKVLTVEIRDAKTKRLIERQPANQTPVLLLLERIDGRWLVGQLTITDEGGS
jgi:hypothetical protein